MKILEKDIKHGIVVVRTTTTEDLWILKQIIKPDNIVVAKAFRVIKPKQDRSDKKKISINVKLLVKRLKIENDKIRITGTILESDKDIGTGKLQSINVGIGDVLTIIKENWNEYEIRLLESAETAKGQILLVAFDLYECAFAIFSNYTYKIVEQFESNIKKVNLEIYEQDKKEYFGLISSKIIQLDSRYNFDLIIIGSPLDWKDIVKNLLCEKNPKICQKIFTETISYGGEAGIHEITRRKETLKILERYYTFKIKLLVEELKSKLIDGQAIVNLNTIKELINTNAISVVLVTEELLESLEESGDIEWLVNSYKRGVKIYIVPKFLDEYYFLKKLGGVAAILRYKIF